MSPRPEAREHPRHDGADPLDTLTAATLVETLVASEMRVLVDVAGVVIAERRIAGERFALRRLVAQTNPDGSWRVAYLFATPARTKPYEYTLVARRPRIADALELGLFVGGCHSVPYSARETACLAAGAL